MPRHNIEPFDEDIHIISSDLDIIQELKERQRAEVTVFSANACSIALGASALRSSDTSTTFLRSVLGACQTTAGLTLARLDTIPQAYA